MSEALKRWDGFNWNNIASINRLEVVPTGIYICSDVTPLDGTYIKLPNSLCSYVHNKSKIKVCMKIKRKRINVKEDLFSINFALMSGNSWLNSLFEVSLLETNNLRVGARSHPDELWQSRSTIDTFTNLNEYMIIECELDLMSPSVSIIVNGVTQSLASGDLIFDRNTWYNLGTYTGQNGGAITSRAGYSLAPFHGYVGYTHIYIDDILTAKYELKENSGTIVYDILNNYNASMFGNYYVRG